MPADVPIGHKLARTADRAGRQDRQVRRADRLGDGARSRSASYVHVHNVKSDYTPTYHLEDVRTQYGSGA